MIFGRLGHLPDVGEKVELLGLAFTVQRVEARRIKTVIAQCRPADGEAAG